MSRTDRGVAQRYAARKRKKRAGPDRLAPPRPTALDRSADSGEETLTGSSLGLAEPKPPAPQPSRSRPTAARATPTVRVAAPPRRAFVTYGDEYRYVLDDLKRVTLIAGGLLLALILLWLVMR